MHIERALRWDIFCEVIDNFGDAGVCWRLACQLAARGQRVRLWIDDASPLVWMAPNGHEGIEVHAWPTHADELQGVVPGDVLVEAFGCSPPNASIAHFFAAPKNRLAAAPGGVKRWINLEHLTAESFAERSHRLPSPVQHGPGNGLTRYFFYPGFTDRTGGLLREPDLSQQRAGFDRASWLNRLGIPQVGEQLIALFCYEPPALDALLNQLAQAVQPTRLLVTAGRSTAAVRHLTAGALSRGSLQIHPLPPLSQHDFDRLLWAADFNFVRGEDSLVRALWATRPFVWQAYPQEDGAHHAKIEALLETLQLPSSLAHWHRLWNHGTAPAELPSLELSLWQASVDAAAMRQQVQLDLATQLLQFVQG